MSVLSDDLYLENIEEYVEDDRRIVTYKWLSRTLSVPVDAAKKMLYQYVSQRSRPLSVMYCTIGKITSQEDDEKKIVINLVSEKELEDTKSQYSELWDVHVYSVQLSPVKESCVLYSSDYQAMMKDHLVEYNKWNNISCDITSKPLPSHAEATPATAWSSENCTSIQKVSCDQVLSTEHRGTKTVKKDTTKKKKALSKTSVSSFFNEKAVKNKPASIDTAVVSSSDGNVMSTVKDEPISPTDTVPPINPTSNINSKEIKLETVESPRKLDKSRVECSSTGLKDSDFEDENDVSSDTTSVFKSKKSEKKTKKYTKATKKVSGKATDHSTSGKKRKRVLKMASSSDDDSDHGSSDAKAVASSPNQEQCKRRRKRVRRLVTKNTVADDGSMVTEKMWEDVSTDASSNEENDSSTVAVIKEKSAPKVEFQSPNKRTKQSSLMSFFKK